MPTHDHGPEHTVDLLTRLVQLEYDTMAAYRAAIGRVDDIDARAELALFFEHHEATANALATCITRYGGTADAGMDLDEAWSRGRVAIADLADDHALLEALAHVEDEIHTAYEHAQSDLRSIGDPPLASAVESALAAEEFHREWLRHAS